MKKRKDNKGRILKDGEYQRATGQYEYRYTDSFSGKQRSVYAWRLNETDGVPEGKKRDKSLRELEKEILKNDVLGIDAYAADRTTINDLFGMYLDMKPKLRETTRALYRNCYNRYIRDTIGSRPVGGIRYSQIYSLYLSLMRDRGLSHATLVPVNAVLHSMFEIAVRDGIILTNPASRVLGELNTQNGTEVRKRKSLTPEQQAHFLDFVMTDERCRQWRSLLTVLFGTGIRIGELCGLVWSDVDFRNNVIRINRTLGYGKRLGDECDYYANPPKSEAGRREIPMTQQVRDVLHQEYTACLHTGFCTAEVDGVTGFVFWKRTAGVPFRRENIDSALGRLVEAYNRKETERAHDERREPVLIPTFSAHCIRHTVASQLVRVETNVKAVQEILGHASAKMTLDVYAEAMPEDKAATMRKFESGVLTG